MTIDERRWRSARSASKGPARVSFHFVLRHLRFTKDALRTMFPAGAEQVTLRVSGAIPPELWNRLGTKLLPKLGRSSTLRLGLDVSLEVDSATASALLTELRQVLADLNLTGQVRIEIEE